MHARHEIEESLRAVAARLRVRARQTRIVAAEVGLVDRSLLEAFAANLEADAAEVLRVAEAAAGAEPLDARKG
jgi:hypothetical protein